MSTTIINDPLQNRGRLKFCLLALFFALPVVIVTLMYKFEWHPQGSSQGVLIAPPKPIVLPSGLHDAKGNPVDAGLFRDKWSMVYVSNECEETCMQRLHIMRQLHASMAKDSNRIQRILLTQAPDLQRLRTDYPDLIVIDQPSGTVQELSRSFQDNLTDTHIYLVDPLANLMMSFPDTVEPKAIRKDLVRLLKTAWAG